MKNTKKAYIIIGILFVLFSIIDFVIPKPKTASFWLSYIFAVVAFAVQCLIWHKASKAEKPPISRLLGYSVIHIGIVYLILQTITGLIFSIFSSLPAWTAVIISIIILGISAVCLISSDMGITEVTRVEEKVKEKVLYIREIQTDIEILASKEENEEIKRQLSALAEKVRFSDPMSNEKLAEIEKAILSKTSELKTADNKGKLINEISSLIDERNIKCKIYK